MSVPSPQVSRTTPCTTRPPRYVIGLTDTREYRDGWVWFAMSADDRLGTERARWKNTVHPSELAPRGSPLLRRCRRLTWRQDLSSLAVPV